MRNESPSSAMDALFANGFTVSFVLPGDEVACTTSSRPPHTALHVRDDRDTKVGS